MDKEKFLPLFLILLFSSCKNNHNQEISLHDGLRDNQELIEIYNSDQTDRRSANFGWEELNKRDLNRRKRVQELLDSNKVKSSIDYQNAAMIFQHGRGPKSYEMAVKLMEKSIEIDSTANKWLLAAATDRYLLSKNEPQIYGTQYSQSGPWEEPWRLDEIDTTKVSDAERIEFGVETLEEQRENVKRMNRKKIPDLLKQNITIEEIVKIIVSQSKKEPEYDISERAINSFGYSLMEQKRNDEALSIFKANIELYPSRSNTWDSYGECLLLLGRKKEGLKAYKKSLELNPANENARAVLNKTYGVGNF